MTYFGPWLGQYTPESYSAVAAGSLSLTVLLDLIWLSINAPPLIHIVWSSLILLSILFVIWLISLRFGPAGVFNHAMHFWFGYCVCCLMHFANMHVTVTQSLLPVLSVVLRVFTLLGCLVYEGFSYSNLVQCRSLEVIMWFGFSCGSFSHDNIWRPLQINCVLLVYWFVLRQRSFLCIITLLFQCFRWFLFSIPSWSYPANETDVSEFQLPKLPSSSYYLSSFVPLFIVYILYLLRFNFIPGLFFCRDLATRWSSVILSSQYFRTSLLLMTGLLQLSFFVCCALSVRPKGFYLLLIPLIIYAFLGWLLIHWIVYISLWHLNRKVTQCAAAHQSLGQHNSDLLRIGAAHGIRHLVLVSQNSHIAGILFTILLMLCAAYPRGLLASKLFELCVPVELCLCSVFYELGRILGGTAAGHGLIMQQLSSDLLHDVHGVIIPQSKQLSSIFSQRCFDIMQLLRTFFEEFSVRDYGCVYSSGMNTNQSLMMVSEPDGQNTPVTSGRSKVLHSLSCFFRHQLPETGVRFDTYLLYHSGPTNQDGDWICEDGTVVDLQSILELWNDVFVETNTSPSRCRLLLVVDSLNTFSWYQRLMNLETPLSVALQTVIISRDANTASTGFLSWITSGLFQSNAARRASLLNDVEQIGKFTDFWVSWNLSLGKRQLARGVADNTVRPRRPAASVRPSLRAVYTTTGNWVNYTPCKPSFEEMQNCWQNHFPRITWEYFRLFMEKPMDKVDSDDASCWSRFFDLLSRYANRASRGIARLYRRLFHNLYPPELDTGLGFFLIRKSF
ncbi:Transmembrane protein 168 [Clonorchis sinensis]|uniref:Transmembrane protein 168 n=1 Tax=Clonorchis sinensis TaxID=79923 RepID=A0A419PXD3_CLOSI|nr:Transmembrane protein 168 [Clonorchis sinensis]